MISPVGHVAAMKLRLVLAAAVTAGAVPVAIGVYLVIREQPEPSTAQDSTLQPSFTISGTADSPPAPGSTVPIRLKLTNPHPFAIRVHSLNVRVNAVAGRGGPARCARGNFAVRQFTGGYGFVVAAARSSTLTELGFKTAEWPQLNMINAKANQDGCKSVTITLAVVGAAGWAAP